MLLICLLQSVLSKGIIVHGYPPALGDLHNFMQIVWSLFQDSVSDRGGVVPIVMALGSCDFAYIRVHRRTGKHRVLGEEEIKRYDVYDGGDSV